MKKGGDGSETATPASTPKQNTAEPKQKQPAPHLPRGKKAKLKKMKTKYAHQDEEERQAMMDLLKVRLMALVL